MRIRRLVYTPVARLHAEIVRSAEPIPFDVLDRTDFRPLRPGTHWGRVFDCAWLRITGDVPAGVENAVVMLGIRGEGLVHSPDGRTPRLGEHRVPAGRSPAQRGSSTGPCATSTRRRGGSSSSPTSPTTAGSSTRSAARSTTARISPPATTRRTRSTTTTSPSLVLADATEDAALEAELRRALRDAYARVTRGDLAGARATLAEPLSAPSTSDFVYSAVGHGHLDMAWLWPLRETRRKAARTYVRALNTIDRRDDYIYGTCSAAADGLDEAAASGPLRADEGGPSPTAAWSCRARSGSSPTRTCRPASRSCGRRSSAAGSSRRSSGSPTTSCGSAGCPTRSATTATCRRSSGAPGWTGSRPSSSRGTRSTTSRTAPSTGRASTDRPCSCTCPPRATTTAAGRPTTCSRGLKQYPEIALEHGAPGLRLGRRRRRTERDPPRGHQPRAGPPRPAEGGVLVGRTPSSVRSSSARSPTPTSASSTSRPTRARTRLRGDQASTTGSSSASCTRSRPSRCSRVTTAGPCSSAHWRDVLLNQFHDILPGSSIARVNREAIETYERIEAAARRLRRRARRPPAAQARRRRPALNLTSLARSEFVKTDDELVPGGRRSVCGGPSGRRQAPTPSSSSSADTLSNGILTLQFDAGPARSSRASTVTAPSTPADGLNRLVVHKDPLRLAVRRLGHRAATMWTRRRARSGSPQVETTVDGPLVVRRPDLPCDAASRSTSASSSRPAATSCGSRPRSTGTRSTGCCAPSSGRPTTARPCGARSSSATSSARRPSATPSRRPSSRSARTSGSPTEDDGGGFALLNDGKYGHRAKNGLLSLNLLRSPTFPDKTADRGIHRFTYAFCPFETGDLAKVDRARATGSTTRCGSTDGVAFDSLVERR